jgi:hypothetical protein
VRLEISRQTFEKLLDIKFIKILAFGAELFMRIDRLKDLTRLIVDFRCCTNVPNETCGCNTAVRKVIAELPCM